MRSQPSSCSQYTTSSPYESDSTSDYELEFDGDVRGGTFTDQFLALMDRNFQHINRGKCGFALEIIVPLIFLALTIFFWFVWPLVTGTGMNFMNYTGTIAAMPNAQIGLACYNDPNNPIPTLLSCEQFQLQIPFECEGDDSSIPVSGLCYMAPPKDSGSGSVESATDLPMDLGPLIPVQLWLDSFRGSLVRVPSMDTLIILQWLARKANSTTRTLLLAAWGERPPLPVALYSSGQVLFVGENVGPLIEHFNTTSKLFRYVYNGTFATVKEAEAQVTASVRSWAIVDVRSLTRERFEVFIHMNSTALPIKDIFLDMNYAGGYFPSRAENYAVSGFLTFQKIISEYYLQNVVASNGETQRSYEHFVAGMGHVPYTNPDLLLKVGIILPFIFTLAFLYPVVQLVKRIVLEKELRIREAMEIMGLRVPSLYLSWYVRFLLSTIPVCIITVTIFKFTFIPSSDVMAMLLIYVTFVLTCVPLATFFAAFFSKARIATLMTPLLFFTMTAPLFVVSNPSKPILIAFCFLPPSAFAMVLLNLITMEVGGGFKFSSFRNPLSSPDSATIMGILAADFVLYNLFAVYLDLVIPKDCGSQKHPLFFIIDPIRWFKRSEDKTLEGGADGRHPMGVFELGGDISGYAVSICGLRKVYKRGGKKFTAVNNLYWGMREGEISVLLGHNGAGKTTVMNMLTGMTKPDQGDCYIYGYSVRQQLSQARQLIGYCPQHNILWPELTCREHLEFFGKIKGLKGKELEASVFNMLCETDLLEKMNQPARRLSGGQKRKLSVGIAFSASSQLVFLDEPTAGMDVGARRHTWELLRRMSDTHSILLTTHYMDEADLLGHRIGIMSQGRLKCSGTSMFLKSSLGVGYNISLSLFPKADTYVIADFIRSFVDSADELSVNACEATYRLPKEFIEQFPPMLRVLERDMKGMGVRGFSLSATTLEEVFLKVSQGEVSEVKGAPPESTSQLSVEDQTKLIWECELLKSNTAIWQSQFSAMMAKRLWNSLRDRRMQCFQVVCPVVCILIAMLLAMISFDGASSVTFGSTQYPVTTMVDMCGCNDYLGEGAPFDTFSVNYCNFANAQNLSWYEVDTYWRSPNPRVGGVFCKDPDIAAGFSAPESVTHLLNSSAFHQAPISLNAFYSALYRNLVGGGNDRRLTMGIGSLPDTERQVAAKDTIKIILMSAVIAIPFTFLPSIPVAWIVKERQCKARHLQNVSGLRFYVYWCTNFLFDMTAYMITMILVLIIFLIFNKKEFISSDRIGPTFSVLLTYGFSSTTMAYLLNFIFNEHSTAQAVVLAASFVGGFLLLMAVLILSILPSTTNTSRLMRWGARVIPSFSVGEGIVNLAMMDSQALITGTVSPWSMSIVGWPCVYMAAEFPLFLIITLIIDHPGRRTFMQRRTPIRQNRKGVADEEDSDVEEERQEVYNAVEYNRADDMVSVIDLRKVYPNGKVAVQDITFGVKPGEVFGFLGTNGAGKTTTISILCQEFYSTSGQAYICGYDVVRESSQALQCIGYCPQFDATLDLLTVEEHLYLYAGVRGIRQDQRREVVHALMRICELTSYRRTRSHELSGGNRRKLSVAISLIGGPRVVFLDEPSAGMDPVARRGLWTAIETVADNCSVVLTTHHLEEVEALAHRVAIMVDGTLRCIGDKTHLKNKYGSGFEMSIRVEHEDDSGPVADWVERFIPSAILNEQKSRCSIFELPHDAVLSKIFEMLLNVKDELHIIDYSLSQTSIEQVFLKISGELED